MPPATITQHPPARRAQHQAFLNEKRLHHFFKRIAAFGEGRRQRLNPTRAAIMMLRYPQLIPPIHRIKAERINLQPPERRIGHGAVRDLFFHQREITHTP